ncbi:lipopolysaccharide export system permease protein [Litorimonas taeanensis]|uniref:Lipopolysaccharide export system permease protein n=1 Tax=Litorimonas taeanensis TaxID=568099 RepID=A0A420WIN0_9PROT|nr:LptF/LptG family permease [Litorimonas taeanensis]RKQ70789.1 lipopolysaccharide export system permease protein [Litorimonas taeanensis]
MGLIQRYFQGQTLWPLATSLAALTGLAILTQSLQTLDLIVENRQSGLAFIKIIGLALPQLIAIILPLSAFIATLYAFNRLNVDSELIIAKAAGFSPWQIAKPIVFLGFLVSLLHLTINLFIQPYAFRQMRAEILEIRTDIVSQMVQQGEFVSPFSGLTAYTREIGADNSLQDVMIYDARDPLNTITLTAKEGDIQRQNDVVLLTLRHGSVQKHLEDGSLDVVQFSDYLLDLSDLIKLDDSYRLKPSDRYLHELFFPSESQNLNLAFRKELRAEGHSRLASPLYNLALILLALMFLARGEHQRLGYTRKIAICAVIGFIIRLSGFGITSAAAENASLNAFQYFIPLAVIIFSFVYLLKSTRLKKWGTKKRARQYMSSVEALEANAIAPKRFESTTIEKPSLTKQKTRSS